MIVQYDDRSSYLKSYLIFFIQIYSVLTLNSQSFPLAATFSCSDWVISSIKCSTNLASRKIESKRTLYDVAKLNSIQNQKSN